MTVASTEEQKKLTASTAPVFRPEIHETISLVRHGADHIKPEEQTMKTNKKHVAPSRPEWMDAKEVKAYFGLSRTVLFRLYKAGRIKTASIKDRGQIKGKRLFFSDSISALLESYVEDNAQQDA